VDTGLEWAVDGGLGRGSNSGDCDSMLGKMGRQSQAGRLEAVEGGSLAIVGVGVRSISFLNVVKYKGTVEWVLFLKGNTNSSN
jgi:hypothetical protein